MIIVGAQIETEIRNEMRERRIYVGDSSPPVTNIIIGATQKWVTSKRKREDHLLSVYNVNLLPTSSRKQILPWSIQSIKNDANMVSDDGNDLIVITIGIANFDVKRILIDDRSVVEIFFYNAFKEMGLVEKDLSPTKPIYGFTNQPI